MQGSSRCSQWLDDETAKSSGYFRILRRNPEVAAILFRMKILGARSLILASVLAATLLILVMELLAVAGFFIVASIWHGVAGFVITALVGALAGYLFKDKIENAYPVAIFSLLFAYAGVRIVGFLGRISVVLVYASLIVLSMISFSLLYRYFRNFDRRIMFKVVVISGLLLGWIFLSSVMSLYFTRISYSY